MAAQRSTAATEARWLAGSWTAAFLLAITGFWPWWAFHSGTGTVVWLVFVVVVFALIQAARRGHR